MREDLGTEVMLVIDNVSQMIAFEVRVQECPSLEYWDLFYYGKLTVVGLSYF